MPLNEVSQADYERALKLLEQYEAGGLTQQANVLRGIIEAYQSKNAQELQQVVAQSPFASLSPEMEKVTDNAIAQDNAQDERVWQEEQSSTNLLKAGAQLEQLGLSASGVLQTGGSNVQGVGAASQSFNNLALARYQQKLSMAKSLLGMTSQMASAGIYGSAIGAARKASSVLSSAAAHSGLAALSRMPSNTFRGKENAPMLRTGNEPGLTPDEEWWNI